MNYLDKKITDVFAGLVVRKDLVKLVKGNAIVPTYVLEYLLGQYCATSDEESIRSGIETVKEILRKHFVHRNEAGLVKSRIREQGRHKVIDKISVKLNDKTDNYEASFSNLGIKKVLINPSTVKKHPKLLLTGVWSIADLEYEYAEDSRICPWIMQSLKPIQMSHFNFEEYIEKRKEFKTDEWLDLLIQSIGFDPGKLSRREKLIQLVRLIPYCERNYNLIELGPKGTGKSHIYSEFSPHGILISGGEVTVPKLFVNNSTGQIGLVGFWDTVAFDEFSGKKKRTNKALVDILKNYMANKSFSRGIETLGAEASMAFVGNTRHNVEYMLKHSDLFDEVPQQYHDSAFFDRLHFYIPGWEVDIIRGEMFCNGYGFVVDYLAEILRSARDRDYSQYYKDHFELFPEISTRDRDGINKTFSGLFKILYPHEKASKNELREILEFAIEGRKRIKDQIMRVDPTYSEVRFGYFDLENREEKPVKTLEEKKYPHFYENRKLANVEDKNENEKIIEENAEDSSDEQLVDENEDIIHIRKLIDEGEGKNLEFKSSVRWDYHNNRMNRNLEYEIAKTIAAFANTEGGVLLIGVNDRGEILGIKKDISTLGKKKSIDGFLLHLDNLISSNLGTLMTANCTAEIIEIEGKQICCMNVNMSSKPVYIKENDFYIRSAASTRKLTTREVGTYIKEHWG